ncbi:MAG: hypothetical protein K8H85_10095 [Cyclobacteriaceae bacterium]|nr:hypothetical protein [Cyclobacteriaceae bacterium]
MISKIEKIKITFRNQEVTAHKLTVTSIIPIDIETAWEKVNKSALLELVSKGKIKFIPTEGKFPEIWELGMTVTTKMIAYGFIPFGGLHTIHFTKIDKEHKTLETEENDTFAKVWNHRISMKSLGDNTIAYEDEIIIYGGILTGFISWWAKSFYKHRQKRWKLLADNKIKLKDD